MQIQYRNLKSILLCTVYRPPDCSMTCFEDEFLEKHTLALTHGKEVIMIGDLNCDILKNSPESRVFRNLFMFMFIYLFPSVIIYIFFNNILIL